MKEVTGLLVMDVDGTLIRQEGIDLLAQVAGVGGKSCKRLQHKQ